MARKDIIKVFFGVFLLWLFFSCASHKKTTTEVKPPIPSVEPGHTKGIVLEPVSPAEMNQDFPIEHQKDAENLDKSLTTLFSGVKTFSAQDSILIPFERSSLSLMLITINLYGTALEDVSVELFQEGKINPIWIGEAFTIYETRKAITSRFIISADITALNPNFYFKLANKGNQELLSHIFIGVIDLSIAQKEDGR